MVLLLSGRVQTVYVVFRLSLLSVCAKFQRISSCVSFWISLAKYVLKPFVRVKCLLRTVLIL